MSDDESAALYEELEVVQAAIDAGDLWDLDRRVSNEDENLE